MMQEASGCEVVASMHDPFQDWNMSVHAYMREGTPGICVAL